MITNINGIVLTDESTETIRRFQENGIEGYIEILDNMIDIILYEGNVSVILQNPKRCLDYIQDLRSLEKLILTFKKPQDNGK